MTAETHDYSREDATASEQTHVNERMEQEQGMSSTEPLAASQASSLRDAAETHVMVGQVSVPHTAPMPQVATDPEPDPRDQEIDQLRRRLHGNRILTVGLSAGVLILMVAMITLASGVFRPSNTPQEPPQQTQSQDMSEQEDGESAATDNRPSNNTSDSSSADDTNNTVSSELGELSAADLSEIVGEKWSNARKILEAYGVDVSQLVIITDDGSQVMNDRNWTVTLVADLQDSDLIAVHLRHDVSFTPGGILDQLGL